MAQLLELVDYIDSLFESKDNPEYVNERAVTNIGGSEVKRIGYCTNLTLDVLEKAKKLQVDLLITHHDAWTFIGGLKEQCLAKLKEYGISHYYNHLPLDDSSFGTNMTLLRKLGLTEVQRTCEADGFMCGVVGEYEEARDFHNVCELVSESIGEKIQKWQFNNRKIKRVHILCGAGHLTTDMKVGVDLGCDLYITGERILYTIEYAQLASLNLIVGSHTFTELPGVESLVKLVKEKYDLVETVLIEEEHLEAVNL